MPSVPLKVDLRLVWGEEEERGGGEEEERGGGGGNEVRGLWLGGEGGSC